MTPRTRPTLPLRRSAFAALATCAILAGCVPEPGTVTVTASASAPAGSAARECAAAAGVPAAGKRLELAAQATERMGNRLSAVLTDRGLGDLLDGEPVFVATRLVGPAGNARHICFFRATGTGLGSFIATAEVGSVFGSGRQYSRAERAVFRALTGRPLG